jgi:hypothetical protein
VSEALSKAAGCPNVFPVTFLFVGAGLRARSLLGEGPPGYSQGARFLRLGPSALTPPPELLEELPLDVVRVAEADNCGAERVVMQIRGDTVTAQHLR